MALIDLASVSISFGIAQSDLSAADQAKLQLIIDDVSEAIERYTEQRFEPTNQTDYLDGGLRALALRGRPVISILALYDTLTDAVNPVDSITYTLDPDTGLVYQAETANWGSDSRPWGPGLAWGHGLRRWRVDYTFGTATVPKNVHLAALDCIKSLFNQNGAGVTAESIGDYSYQRDVRGTDVITAAARDLLSRNMSRVNI